MASLKGDSGGGSGISIPNVYGVWGDSRERAGVIGTCAVGAGVRGESINEPGALGGREGAGVFGIGSNGATAVRASVSDDGIAVWGLCEGNNPTGDAIVGSARSGTGVVGASESGVAGAFANTNADNNNPVIKVSTKGAGPGIQITTGGPAISATSSIIANTTTVAIQGNSDANAGVDGFSGPGPGVRGRSPFGTGILASGGTIGLHAAGGGAFPPLEPPEGFSAAVFAEGGSSFGVWTQSDTGIALVVKGLMQILGNAVGQTTLPSGQTSVIVNTSAATPTSNILLTPLDNPRGQLWVTRATGSFTIHTSVAPGTDVPIAYLIIN